MFCSLYFSADFSDLKFADNLRIYSNGDTFYYYPMMMKSMCLVDIQNFPFDDQRCAWKFISWDYHGFEVDLDFYEGLEEFDLGDNYHHSNSWRIVDNVARKNVRYYTCCEEPYVDITYRVTLRRVPTFYILTLIFPGILLSVLSMVIYWIPIDGSDRTQVGKGLFPQITTHYWHFYEQTIP